MTTPLPAAVTAALLQYRQIALDRILWPGWDPLSVPLVLHGEGVAYLIGHPEPPPGFEPMGRIGGSLITVGVPTPEMAANTAALIAGHWCALAMLPNGELQDVNRYARLLLHEAFHVHHFAKLAEALPPPVSDTMQIMARYPETDPLNNALAIVENRLLSDSLTGDDEPAPSFLAVRLARHQRLATEFRAYELCCEYSEGLAHYVEARAGLPASELALRLREASVGGKWAAWQRFYYTGAAQALLLDRLLPGWQERLLRGGETLQSLLLATVGEPLPEASGVLEAAGYAEILTAEQEREAARQAEVAQLLHQLYSGPGIMVEVTVPPEGFVLFDPRNIQVVEPGVRLHTRMTGIRAPGGVQVDIGRLCLERQEPHRLLLRLPEQPAVTGTEPWRLQGDSFLATGPGGSVEAAFDAPDRLLVRFAGPLANAMD